MSTSTATKEVHLVTEDRRNSIFKSEESLK